MCLWVLLVDFVHKQTETTTSPAQPVRRYEVPSSVTSLRWDRKEELDDGEDSWKIWRRPGENTVYRDIVKNLIKIKQGVWCHFITKLSQGTLHAELV